MATASFSPQSLPNRFDFNEAQKRWYRHWEDAGYFHAQRDPDRVPYTIVIPPPNVTGALHLGHALNNTLQDVLVRMRRMQGYCALWMPGTDHAGIATQAVVEKRLREEEGKTRNDLGREQLVQRIWQWKNEYEARIIDQLKEMGCSCDWERLRFTLDETCAKAVRRTFFDLFRQRLIYRGKRLVNWDTFLQTAVSDDEVFHDTVEGHFWRFRYPVIDPREGEPTHVEIATTRPETMLGDTAVAVHPDPAAAFEARMQQVRADRDAAGSEKDRGAARAELETLERQRDERLQQLELLRDMARDGRMLRLPLLERVIPLITDEWAKPEMGSGCVKITPAHDPNDYEVGQRCDLPMVNILHPDGTLNEAAGPYAGLAIAEARQRVVADLEQQELVVAVEDRVIELAHSDRSKTPIEPYLADQWFVRMDDLAQSAMDAVSDGRVEIVPSRYAKGYHDWLAEKRDWPVSRQLWWGHQIPIWTLRCRGAEERDSWVRRLADDEAAREGRLHYEVESSDEDGGDDAVVHVCLRDEGDSAEQRLLEWGFARDPDVLDTWFSSALWPHSTLGWPDRNPDLDYFYPTSDLITSRDIITLWVARMVLAGLNNLEEVPFRRVFIHPKILDRYGETMSKSKGNGVDPVDVIDKFGADALRFGLAHLTTETQDVRMSVQFECPHCDHLIDQTSDNRELPRLHCPECGEAFATQWARTDEDRSLPRAAVLSDRFEVARNFCNKLWNAARFSLMHLEDYQPTNLDSNRLEIEDRWILSRLASVTAQTTTALDHFRYGEAARVLYEFAWDEFCSFYLEMTKSRFQDAEQRPIAQAVLAASLDQLMRLLHPMMPFLTEEVWQLLAKVAPERGIPTVRRAADSVMIAEWPGNDADEISARRDETIEARFAYFQQVLSAIREIRSRQNLPPRQTVRFAVQCSNELADLLRPMEPQFAAMAQAQATGWGPAAEQPRAGAAVHSADYAVFVDLEGLIDVDAEVDRLQKQLEKLSGAIRGKQGKLGNKNFVERAPQEVVERERESLEKLQAEHAATSEAVKLLTGE